MKKILLFLFAIASSAIYAQSLSINTNNSKVNWKAYKVTGSHEGTIKVKSGNLNFNGSNLSGGSFIFDMNTINCTDLDGRGKSSLEGHLKSPDFFDVANHQESKFEVTKVVSKGKVGEYKILGNLTIKGITKPIKFDALIIDGMAKGSMKIDRTEFDVRYGSGTFFDSLGDKTIYDEFDINFELFF